MAKRPSKDHDDAVVQREIDRVRAVFDVEDPEWYPAYAYDLEADWQRLKCQTNERMLEALRAAVRQITVHDWDPPPPPGTGRERAILGAAIQQFVFDCDHFGCLMFFRFAFKDGYLFISALHPADYPRKPKGGQR